MAKFELNKAPLFNVFFKDMQISVKRASRMDSHRAYMRAMEELDLGHSVFLFPEGTIPDAEEIKSFKNGPFKLAIEKQIPILPITFTKNRRLLENGGFFKSAGRPGVTRAIIHPIISTKGMDEKNIVALRERVFNLIHSTYLQNQ